MKLPLLMCVTAAALSGAASMQAQAAVIVSTDFVSVSAGSKYLNGTNADLAINLPEGNWVWGAGWNWLAPHVPATWQGSQIKDVAYLGEEDTALGISISSNGGYVKPDEVKISADLRVYNAMNNTVGLGFWSAMPARLDGGAASALNNFTGLILNEMNGTLQVYSGGTLAGSATSVGTVVEGQFYNLEYTIDTSTGELKSVFFDGNVVTGLSSTAFTDAATAFAGALSGSSSRLIIDNFVVEAVPEPAMVGLAGLLLAGLKRRRI